MVATELCKYETSTEKGLHCINCGHKPIKGKPIYRGCPTSVKEIPQVQVCKYLGKESEIVLIPCITCQGNVKIKYQSNECSLKEKCLPDYQPDNLQANWGDYAICQHCSSKVLTTSSTEL